MIDPSDGSRTVAAHVVSITHHDSGVKRITLTLERSFRHRPGQYLNVVHPNGADIPFSIASAPERLPELELHYRPTPGVAHTQLMNDLLARAGSAADEWRVDGPHGNVIVEGPTTEALWLFAGGTGIAQCRCIVEHLHRVAQNEPVSLVWSVTDAAQLYCDSELRAFASWLSYRPLVDAPGSPNAAAAWLRETDVAIRGRVISSGSPGFVYALDDVIRKIAMAGTSFESDVFSYAPRP